MRWLRDKTNMGKTMAPGQRVATVLVLTVNASFNTDFLVDNVGQRTYYRVEPTGGFASQRVTVYGSLRWYRNTNQLTGDGY